MSPDLDTFRQRRLVFAGLNAAVLAILLLLHAVFSSFWGKPPGALLALFAGSLVLRLSEGAWFLRHREPPRPRGAGTLVAASIALNLLLATALASVVDREDSQYFALLAVPVLEAAFHLSLPGVLGVVALADTVTFYWVRRYDLAHPPVDVGEYFEAGTISLIFAIVAVLVALLVRQLRAQRDRLARSYEELRSTRERLLAEEKLAAVGRLSSALAHEIRNPVAILMSSLAAAKRRGGSEREDLLAIAGQEASRLAGLTADFLTYARPRAPNRVPQAAADVLRYAADVCRVRAADQGVAIEIGECADIVAELDAGMLRQALINLVLNALEASPAGAVVRLALRGAADQLRIEVSNPGEPIPDPIRARLFEPFCTTKPGGTGLGLAIARGIARAHGGDLVLNDNRPGQVAFCLTLPAGKTSWAASSS